MAIQADKVISLPVRLSSPTRRETFLGREFVVAPAVLVRSQVLENNLGSTFLPPEDITEDWAYQWNGIPVLVGPHPTQRGQSVSGRTPALWNARCAGWIFNAQSKQETERVRHLAGEVWLDKSRAAEIEGFQLVLDKLASGEIVELSTGFNAQIVPNAGTFEGSAYEAIIHPVTPDHLVISTEMTGACSVADGCGLGVNKYQGKPPMSDNNGTVETPTEETKPEGWARKQWAKVKTAFSAKNTAAENSIEAKIAVDEHYRASNEMPVSDMEKQSQIRDALQEKYESVEVIISDIYSAEGWVIFWTITPFGAEPQGGEYFRVSFSEGSDGTFTFGDTPEKVRRVTGYEPVGNSAGTVAAANCGCKSKKTEDTIMANDTKPSVDEQLAALVQGMGALTKTVEGLVTEVGNVKAAQSAPDSATLSGLKKSMAQLAETVNSMKSVTEDAVAEKERERRSLIESLAGNYKVPFTEGELETKPLVELRKISEMASADYSGRGGAGRSDNSSRQESTFMPTKPYWEKEDKGGK